MGKDRRVNGLGVRPPQFHVCFEWQRWKALYIHEVVQSAVLSIPAEFERAFDRIEQKALHLCIGICVEQEPGTLYGIPGAEKASLRRRGVGRILQKDAP